MRSADKPFFAIQKWLNESCLKLNIPLLNVGYAAGDEVMGPLVMPGLSACLACNGYLDDNNYYLTNSREADEFSNHFKASSFACLNSLISSEIPSIYMKDISITEKVSLRQLTSEDLDHFYKWASDPDVAKSMTWEAYTSRAEATTFLKEVVENHP